MRRRKQKVRRSRRIRNKQQQVKGEKQKVNTEAIKQNLDTLSSDSESDSDGMYCTSEYKEECTETAHNNSLIHKHSI
jgi:hypothetical protein